MLKISSVHPIWQVANRFDWVLLPLTMGWTRGNLALMNFGLEKDIAEVFPSAREVLGEYIVSTWQKIFFMCGRDVKNLGDPEVYRGADLRTITLLGGPRGALCVFPVPFRWWPMEGSFDHGERVKLAWQQRPNLTLFQHYLFRMKVSEQTFYAALQRNNSKVLVSERVWAVRRHEQSLGIKEQMLSIFEQELPKERSVIVVRSRGPNGKATTRIGRTKSKPAKNRGVHVPR